MRIITGIYKGRHFEVPRSFKARPTTDFAKENLFNVLRAYVDFGETRALDLFGGTGSISLELLSRGCREVVTVERDRRHFAFIAACFKQLADPASTALCTDALRFIERCPRQFDLVFADPPMPCPSCPSCPAASWAAASWPRAASSCWSMARDTTFRPVPTLWSIAPMAASIFPSSGNDFRASGAAPLYSGKGGGAAVLTQFAFGLKIQYLCSSRGADPHESVPRFCSFTDCFLKSK